MQRSGKASLVLLLLDVTCLSMQAQMRKMTAVCAAMSSFGTLAHEIPDCNATEYAAAAALLAGRKLLRTWAMVLG